MMDEHDDDAASLEASTEPRTVTVALLAVASRGGTDDPVSGLLADGCRRLGHRVIKRLALPPAREAIESQLRAWIAEDSIDVILVSGGIGLLPGDVTPEAIRAVVEREIPGYGEAMRAARSEHVGLRAIHAREVAGVAASTFVLAVSAEREAFAQTWDAVLEPLLHPSSEASLVPLLARLATPG
jgi:molybdenum cofactor biosynthesis protein B